MRQERLPPWIGGTEVLRPESLMMSYGLRPAAQRRGREVPHLPDLHLRLRIAEAGKAFFELAYGLREAAARGGNGADLQPPQQPRPRNPRGPAGAVGRGGVVRGLRQRHGGHHHLAPRLPHPRRRAAPQRAALRRLGPLHQALPPGLGRHPIGFQAGVPMADRPPSRRPRSVAGRPLAAVLLETPANPDQRAGGHRGGSPTWRARLSATGPACRGDGGQHLPRSRSSSTRSSTAPTWCIYSATKFIGGHSDIIAGAVLGSLATMLAGARPPHLPGHDDRAHGPAGCCSGASRRSRCG